MDSCRTLTVAVAALVLSSPWATALTISYCSDANTGSSSTLNTSIYQSNGLCETHCVADYAYGIVQGDDCWCSDYAPSSTTNVSDCDSACPGYPSDKCGNPDKGLYGYIALSISPSGTEAGVTGSASSTTSSTSTSSSSEISSTETSTPLVQTVTVTASHHASTSLATSSSSTTDTTTTAAPSLSISTKAGQPVTITVSQSSTSSASSSNQNKSSSLSGGAIAGIVIGSLVGVGAIAAFLLWFFCFGGRRDERSEKTGSPTGGNDGSVAGGTTDTRRQSRGSQMSFMRNFMSPADTDASPTSPNDYLSPNQGFIDNRMKKDAVLYPNGDRQSAVSLRDDEDYSRPVLRLTNPDIG